MKPHLDPQTWLEANEIIAESHAEERVQVHIAREAALQILGRLADLAGAVDHEGFAQAAAVESLIEAGKALAEEQLKAQNKLDSLEIAKNLEIEKQVSLRKANQKSWILGFISFTFIALFVIVYFRNKAKTHRVALELRKRADENEELSQIVTQKSEQVSTLLNNTLKELKKKEQLADDTRLFPYMLTSVRNRCYNYLRDRKVEDKYKQYQLQQYREEIHLKLECKLFGTV